MDDGRLVGTSSSTRSPSGEQHAGEIRTSHSRRPSYVDESIPTTNSIRREKPYSISPPRTHGNVRYDVQERSPYSALGYAPSPSRAHQPQRAWETNRNFRSDEGDYARTRPIPPGGVAPGEKSDWREADWNGHRTSGGYGSGTWEEEYWRSQRDVNEPSEQWARHPGEWPIHRDTPPLRRDGENSPWSPSPRYFGRFPVAEGSDQQPVNGAYEASTYPPLRSPNGRYDAFRETGAYDYYRAPAHVEQPIPVEAEWDNQSPGAGSFRSKHPRQDLVRNGFHVDDSHARLPNGGRSGERRRDFDGKLSRRGSHSGSPSPGARAVDSSLRSVHKAPVNGEDPGLGLSFRSQSSSRHGHAYMSPCEASSRKASITSIAQPNSTTAPSTPSHMQTVDGAVNARFSPVHLSLKTSPRPNSPRASLQVPVLSEPTNVSMDLPVDGGQDASTSVAVPLASGRSEVVSRSPSDLGMTKPVVVEGQPMPSVEDGPGKADIATTPTDLPCFAADALVAEVLADTDLQASFVEARPRVLERALESHDTLDELIQRLRSRYTHLNQQWKTQCERLDRVIEGRKKRFALQSVVTPATAGLAHFFGEESPVVSGRTSRRTGGVFFGDAVRSDLELESIIEKIQLEEAQDASFRARRTAASIPDMDVVSEEYVAFEYDDSNGLIIKPEDFYSVNRNIDSWTPAEEQLFAARYALFPKQFGEIASGMGTKTAAQCVHYYYLNKRRLDFRGKSTTGKRKAGRRAGRGKGSLMADIQAAEEKVKKAIAMEQGHAGADDVTVEYSTPQEDDASTEPDSPGPSATGAPNGLSEDDPTAMDIDAADSKSLEDGGQNGLEVTEDRVHAAGSQFVSTGQTSVGSTSDSGLGVRKRRSHLDVESGPHPRRKPATSSYWSVQEKLTAVMSHDKHRQDYTSIAADIGTKSAVQVRNFFQNQTSEALAELSERAKGLGQMLPSARTEVDPHGVPVYFDAGANGNAHVHTPSVSSPRPLKAEEPVPPDGLGSFPPRTRTPSFDGDHSLIRQPMLHNEGPSVSHASTARPPIHSLPPISTLPFLSPGSGYRSPPRSRMPISSLLNDIRDENTGPPRIETFDNWFGSTKASTIKPLERRPYERIELPRIPEPWHRGEVSAIPARHETVERYRPEAVDFDPRRPNLPAAGDTLHPRPFPDLPNRQLSPPPGHHSTGEMQRYGYPSHIPRMRTPEDSYSASVYAPFRGAAEAWHEYDTRRASPTPYEYSYHADTRNAIPPGSSSYPERRTSYGAYPLPEFQGQRPPSPRYDDYSYAPQSSVPPQPFDARRVLPPVRDYPSYRPPTPPSLPREPVGYYDGPDQYHRRPPNPPPSQWPEEQERRRYPPEYPDYPDDRRYHGH